MMVETAEPTTTQDAQVEEGGNGGDIQGQMSDDFSTTMAGADSDGRNALDMDDLAYPQPLSPEQADMQETFDSSENERAQAAIDLELEVDEVTLDRQDDATLETGGVVNATLEIDTTQSISQDEVLDEWAELEEGPEDEADRTLVLGKELSHDLDEIQTKLELAQAYMDMGDAEGARSILDEVISEGDNDQKQAAMELIEKLA
jgi:pilus assembly protein FimV